MDAKLICQTVGVALRTPKNQLNLKKITHTIPNPTQSCYLANDQIVGAPPWSHGGERSAAAAPSYPLWPEARRRPHGLVPEPPSEITSEDDPERWGCSAGSVWTYIHGILSLALAFTVMIWLALTFYVLIVTILWKFTRHIHKIKQNQFWYN
jgi:hypothetical protein